MADLLLSNSSATGNGAWKARQAGLYTISVDGTFGGTTVTIEKKSPDGSSGIAIASVSFTAEGMINVEVPSGSYRAVMTGGTPSAMYVAMEKAGNG